MDINASVLCKKNLETIRYLKGEHCMHTHNCWSKINVVNVFLIQYEMKSSCYFICIIQVPKSLMLQINEIMQSLEVAVVMEKTADELKRKRFTTKKYNIYIINVANIHSYH